TDSATPLTPRRPWDSCKLLNRERASVCLMVMTPECGWYAGPPGRRRQLSPGVVNDLLTAFSWIPARRAFSDSLPSRRNDGRFASIDIGGSPADRSLQRCVCQCARPRSVRGPAAGVGGQRPAGSLHRHRQLAFVAEHEPADGGPLLDRPRL